MKTLFDQNKKSQATHMVLASATRLICFLLFILSKLIIIIVGSQIVAQTQMETWDGPNKPSTINL